MRSNCNLITTKIIIVTILLEKVLGTKKLPI